MLSTLKKLFSSADTEKDNPEEETNRIQLAFAALLIEAAKADEDFDEGERTLIHSILQTQFALTDEAAQSLFLSAQKAQDDAVDLHKFTKTVKTQPDDVRIQFIQDLWDIVLSDDVRDPYEDTLIRRICGLINVSDRQSAEARQRVLANK